MELGDLGLGEQIQFKPRSEMRGGHSGSCSALWLPESPHQGNTSQAALEAAGLYGHPSLFSLTLKTTFIQGPFGFPFPTSHSCPPDRHSLSI